MARSQRTRILRRIASRTAGAVCLAALAGALLFPAGAAAQARQRIAVLPVVIHSMDQQAYLQDGLADMLSSRLGQHPGVGVIRVDEAGTATTDAAEARNHGRAAGGDWVLFGSFTRFGNGASLDLRCVRVDGSDGDEGRSVFVQTGTLEQIIPRLSNVAERIAAHVHAGPGAAAPVAAGTPAQPADAAALRALRKRVEALEAEVYKARELAGEAAPE